MQPVFGAKLSSAEREDLVKQIRATPSRYVAQEQVSLSTVPVWDEGRLQPRHMVLRVYAVASGGGYSVMPGGLTRVTSSLDSLVVSMQHGGGSKDTWVLGEGPTPQFSLLRPSSVALNVSRATFDLPSRVADNLFWLGRYVERTDPPVRIARALVPRLSQESDSTSTAALTAGAEILSALGYVRSEMTRGENRIAFLERELLAMIYDSEDEDEPGVEYSPGAPRGLAASRPHFGGRLAHPQPFRSAVLGRPAARASAHERRAGFARPHHHHALGIQRHGDGKHDARPRLALSRHRPAARAGLADGGVAANRNWIGERTARSVARDRRQFAHLPLALSHHHAVGPGARFVVAR